MCLNNFFELATENYRLELLKAESIKKISENGRDALKTLNLIVKDKDNSLTS